MVPYATSTFHPRVGSAGPPPAVQYIDLDTGVNIDCLRELNGKMMLNAQLDQRYPSARKSRCPESAQLRCRPSGRQGAHESRQADADCLDGRSVAMKKFAVEAAVT